MRNLSKLTKIRIAVVALVFVVFLTGGFIYYFNGMRQRSKAAPTGTPELTLSAVTNPPKAGDGTLKVAVKLNPNGVGTELYAFDVRVVFDPAKVELTNADPNASVTLASGILKLQTTLEGNNTVRIVGTRTGTPFTAASQQIGEISFRMKDGADFPVSFTWGSTTLQVTNYARVNLDLASNSTSSSSSTGAGGPALSFSSSKQDYQVGETIMVAINADTDGKEISSVNTVFTYDTAKLTYVGATIETSVFDKPGTISPPTGNTMTLYGARGAPLTGKIKFATVTFKAKAAGKADFAINKDSSSIKTYAAAPANILNSVTPYSVNVTTASSSSSGGSSSEGFAPGEQVPSNGDILYINSTTFDQAPLRYEQIVQLDKGDYILSASALVYTLRGRGVLVAVACAESDCGDGKKLNDIYVKIPNFTSTTTFERKEVQFAVSEKTQKKRLAVRIFVEDGSEADFDFISLTDVWGGEKLENSHFEKTVKTESPRQFPQYWEGDMTGWMYANVDKQQGVDGALYINSSSRK